MLEFLLPGSMTQTLLIGLVVGLIAYKLIRSRKYNFPPGPWSLPLLGNVLQLGSDERYHIKYFEWSKKYGPVITVNLGPLPMVVVNNLETAMEVLVKKSTDFAGRMKSVSLRDYSDGYKDIVLSDYSPTWKLHRRISSNALRHYMLGHALEERIHTALSTTFPVLEQHTKPFAPNEAINFLVSNIITGLCFDGKFEYGDDELKHVIEIDDEANRDFNTFFPEDIVPGLEYIFTSSGMKKMNEAYKIMIVDFIGKKYYEEKQKFNRENVRHLTDSLLLAKEEAEAEEGHEVENLSDEYLIKTLSDIFYAGLDTSRFTLYFAILHMVAFPDIQQKVQDELDREVGLERLPGVADRPNLGYTEAVLHESMRLSSVAPSGVFHETMCDTDISGFKIPKGTIVMINHWALHHDPQAWTDVDKFIPERFLDENGRLGPKPPNWLPFSAGKRVCLGEFVAKPELHLLFATLMQQFTWSSESGVNPEITPRGNSFLAAPAPFKVNVSRRMNAKI